MRQVNSPNQKIKRPSKKMMDAIALPHLVQKTNWFDENGMPHPYVWVGVLCFHLILLYLFTLVEPIIIKKEPIFGVEIIELKEEKPIPLNKIEEIIKPIQKVQKPEPIPIEKNIPLEKLEKPLPEEVKEIEKPKEIEIIPPKEIKNLLIEAKPADKIKSINNEKLEKIDGKITIPEQIEDFKIDEKAPKDIKIIKDNAKIINNIKIQNQKIDTKINVPEQIEDFKLIEKPINNIKIETPSKIINQSNLSKALPKIDNKISVSIEDEIKDKSNKDDGKKNEETKQKEIDKQKLDKEKINSNAPIEKNGELPKPSGITSLGGAIGGGSGGPVVNNTGPKSGGDNLGVLPKKPPSFGAKGRNVFEEDGENGSLIGRVGKSLDCAKLGQKERSEKCPNWQPLEGNIGLKLPPKTPIGLNQTIKTKEPLPPCPPNSPHANLGVKCLGPALKKNQ